MKKLFYLVLNEMSSRAELMKKLHINVARLVKSHLRGSYKSALKGQGIVVANSRLYDMGDDMRHIDRRATARKGDVYVKEYEEERQLQIEFVVDTGISMTTASHDITKRSCAEELVTMLGFVAQQQGDRVGGVFFEDQIKDRIEISRDPVTLYRLQKYFEQPPGGESSLHGVADSLRKHRIRNTLLVFLTDKMPTEEQLSQIRGLGASNEILWIHIFDPFEVTLSGGPSRLRVGSSGVHTSRLIDDHIRKKYLESFSQAKHRLQSTISALQGHYVLLQTDQDVVFELAAYFQRFAHSTR